MKTRASSMGAYLALVGLACGFGSAVFVSTWSHMVPAFSKNALVSDAWIICSLLACVSLGSLYFGPRARRLPSTLRILAYMLVGLGISSLVAPQLLPAVGAAAGTLSGGEGSSIGTTAVGGALVFAIFFVPFFLLGGIIFLCAWLMVRAEKDVRSGLGRPLTFVFIGAASATLVSAFILVPSLGHWRTLIIAATIVALIGLLGLLLKEKSGSEVSDDSAWATRGQDSTRMWVGTAASTVFILAALVCAILGTRLVKQTIGYSVYAGATILSVYLIGIAIGSAVSPALSRRSRDGTIPLIAISAIMGIYWLAVTHLLGHLPSLFLEAFRSGEPTWAVLVAGHFRVSLLVMLTPGILTGLSLPLLGASSPGQGQGTGGHTSAPIVVTALGALLAFALTRSLPAGDMTFGVMLALASWLCIAPALVFVGINTRSLPWRLMIAVVVLVAAIITSAGRPRWNTRIMTSGVFTRPLDFSAVADLKDVLRASDLIFYEEDGDAITSVERNLDRTALKINGRIVSSTGEDILSQVLTAHIPMLIHPNPKRVLLAGMGAGVTLGAIETHNIDEIVCVEPAAAVTRAAEHFLHHNRDALSDRRVRLVTGDIRNYLLSGRPFDVVILQSTSASSCRPGDLLTTEFIGLVRSRLASGGVVCQRLSTANLAADAFRSAARTFAFSFPNVSVWWAGAGELLLVGGMGSLKLDLELLKTRVSRSRIAEDLTRLRLTDHIGILGCYTIGRQTLVEFAGDIPVNTKSNDFINCQAPKASVRRDAIETLRAVDSIKENPVATLKDADETTAEFTLLRDKLELFMRARTLYVNCLASAQAGRLTEAAAGLEQAAVLFDENSIGLLRLSDYYIVLSRSLGVAGRFEDAVSAARRSVEANPLSYRAFYNLATLEMTRDGVLAIALLKRAIEINSDYVPAYLLKAEGELASGDAEEAGKTIGEALSVEPFNMRAHHVRALTLIERGMLDEGRDVLEIVLDAEPDNVEAMAALAYTWFMEDDLDRAQSLYERILRHDPDHISTLHNYATVLAEKGKYREAIRFWTKALGRDPGNQDIIDNIEEARQKLRQR